MSKCHCWLPTVNNGGANQSRASGRQKRQEGSRDGAGLGTAAQGPLEAWRCEGSLPVMKRSEKGGGRWEPQIDGNGGGVGCSEAEEDSGEARHCASVTAAFP